MWKLKLMRNYSWQKIFFDPVLLSVSISPIMSFAVTFGLKSIHLPVVTISDCVPVQNTIWDVSHFICLSKYLVSNCSQILFTI